MSHPSVSSRPEQGFAMITTMLIMVIVTLLVAGSISYSIGSLTISKHDQDWNAALSAAEGGIDDYLYRLNQNSNYWQYGVVPATCPTAPAICPKLPPETPIPNQAFNFSAGKPVYVPIPGGLANGASYHYDVDVSTIGIDGTIKVSSTGKVGTSIRTVRVVVRQRGFLDFLYFTNFDTLDPTYYTGLGGTFSTGVAQTKCGLKYYYSVPPRDPGCTVIDFGSGDTIKGPLHTNDAIRVTGNPQFQGATTDSWNIAGQRWVDDGGGNPGFLNGPVTDPKYAAPLPMPPSSTTIKAQADPTIPITGVGCMYTGPTQVTFNSNGTMNVLSPKTVSINAGCGPGANLALPVNGVIYVQGVPTSTTDPNYTPPCATGFTDELGYPKRVNGNQDLTPYQCGLGDAFVSGALKGQITVAADHDITVVGNLTYQNGFTGTDVLGLVANGTVNVYHPYHRNGDGSFDNNTDALTNPQIQAAMVALAHSFIFPNWTVGNGLGTLNVTGAIGQQYRGIVKDGSTGYFKNYVYDQRLQYLTPPHFLQPTVSSWQIRVWAEEKVLPGY